MNKKAAIPSKSENHLVVFQEKATRRTWHNEEWWFSLSDVIAALTDSADVRQYIKKMGGRDPMLDANWSTTCTSLPLLAPDGKMCQPKRRHFRTRIRAGSCRRTALWNDAMIGRTFTTNHPIYAMLFDLQALDVVRIVENRN